MSRQKNTYSQHKPGLKALSKACSDPETRVLGRSGASKAAWNAVTLTGTESAERPPGKIRMAVQ